MVDKGRVRGYFLQHLFGALAQATLRTTGNAGGSAQPDPVSSKISTHFGQQPGRRALLRKLSTGLFVTELMGQA